MVLSMSTRLAWRWKSLIMSSQFVKQKEQEVGRGERRWNESEEKGRIGALRLNDFSYNRKRISGVKRDIVL